MSPWKDDAGRPAMVLQAQQVHEFHLAPFEVLTLDLLPKKKPYITEIQERMELMVTPTLLVLAAGMGSRYGGLKQIDPVGPDGETIMDYSIYDARRAGFGKVVFVIRKDIEQPFKEDDRRAI